MVETSFQSAGEGVNGRQSHKTCVHYTGTLPCRLMMITLTEVGIFGVNPRFTLLSRVKSRITGISNLWMSSQVHHGGNAVSGCEDNGPKSINKSEADIWWKITGA